MSDVERDELLIRIDEQVKEIKSKLDRDGRMIYGNGKPGLLSRVQSLEDFHRNENTFLKKSGGIIAWIVTTILAAFAVWNKHN
jgi:hypothetical protein